MIKITKEYRDLIVTSEDTGFFGDRDKIIEIAVKEYRRAVLKHPIESESLLPVDLIKKITHENLMQKMVSLSGKGIKIVIKPKNVAMDITFTLEYFLKRGS